jgi:hypothetical protein
MDYKYKGERGQPYLFGDLSTVFHDFIGSSACANTVILRYIPLLSIAYALLLVADNFLAIAPGLVSIVILSAFKERGSRETSFS